MFSFLSEPNYPNAAIGIESDAITAIALDRQGKGAFGVKQVATVPLAAGIVMPSFLDVNISNTHQFSEVLEEAVTSAGLLKQKRWSVALPSSTARTAILTLEAEPAQKSEADEILDWKAEQSIGAAAVDLRISRQSISRDRDGRARYFATAIKLSVIDEFENVFERLGWKVGLILPRAVSETNWLLGADDAGDAMLISGQSDGFTALILRGNEPTVVRSVTCDASEIDDEIYRLLMFYNDRYARELGSTLDRLLVTGRYIVPAKVMEIAADALDHATRVLSSDEVGLHLPDRNFSFDELAAPAGLAALA